MTNPVITSQQHCNTEGHVGLVVLFDVDGVDIQDVCEVDATLSDEDKIVAVTTWAIARNAEFQATPPSGVIGTELDLG